MKSIRRISVAIVAAIAACLGANAQIYNMINQGTSMIQTALSGGFRYRGMADAGYLKGIGNKQADIYEITTTQGLKYADWFFMGIGAGVNILHTSPTNQQMLESVSGKDLSSTACMVPLYTDFRFNIGNQSAASFFIDLRIGASFLMGSSSLQVGNGYINRSECFYLKPSLGFRVPVSKTNPKLAVNFGASYQLISTDYWSSSTRNVYLSSLGISAGFEW